MGLYELAQQCAGIAPAIVIAEALCAVILVDMMAPLNWSRFWGGIVSLVGIVAAVLTLLSQMAAGHAFYRAATFGDMLTHDQLSAFFQMLFLAGTAITVLFSMRSRETDGYRQGEYYCLLLGALLGAMLLASADHFLLFLLGLETLSLCSYVLAGSLKHERLSAEASLKYLIYGAVASGVMLFGISYVYGLTGTLSINKAMSMVVAQLTANQLGHLTFFLVLALLLAGLGFKIAMVPFHFWCPDVYQGAPTPITAFLSVVSKSAGFSALLRVMLPFFLVAKPSDCSRWLR
jgi:NADH-quinone oxidoreductase subunit N